MGARSLSHWTSRQVPCRFGFGVKRKAFSASPELESFDPRPPRLPASRVLIPGGLTEARGPAFTGKPVPPPGPAWGLFKALLASSASWHCPPGLFALHPQPRGPRVSPLSLVLCLNHLLRPDCSFMSTAGLFIRDTSLTRSGPLAPIIPHP